MLLEISPIYPQVDYPSGWLAAAVALCSLAIIAIGIGVGRWRSLAPSTEASADSIREHRQRTLAEISRAAERPEPRLACQEISRLTRRFIGLASDSDADYSSPAQLDHDALMDPRFELVAQFVRDAEDSCFNPAAQPDVSGVAEAARKVVSQWR